MNISYRWLRAIAPTIGDSPHELANRLAMLGAPVDEVVELGAGIRGVVVGRVVEVRPHPNADRLRLCTVDAGTGEALQVVCGASNVEAGRYYPFAPVGASLPGGLAIRRAKLRGEASQGMLCSARELGLGRDQEGIMALAGEWEAGAPFVEAMGLDDVRLVVDVTANRPDLLSHLGVAREVAPGGQADLRLPELPGAAPGELALEARGATAGVAGVQVGIDDAEGCPRYLGAVIRGVRVGPSPAWLASRLRAAGLRPINNVVDATNYVLLELGQPLHAFDLARLGGEVRIRRAAAGERIRTLDGTDRTLAPHMLVIADSGRPVAVAGVMGGEESEVTGATTDLFLECALFDPLLVRKAARALGLTTDSSYRFERGVDPTLQPQALRRLVELIRAVAGGEAAGAAVDLHPRPCEPRVVALRPERVERVLGVVVSGERIAATLGAIGFEIAGAEPLRVTVPGYRPDVTREVDLIEEVARRIGYDVFAEEFLPFRPSRVPEDPVVAVTARLRERFRGRGLLESRTVGFAPAAAGRVPLLNPLSAEESHLRDALAPGLLRRVEHNWAQGTRDVRLFEIGTVFLPGSGADPVREELRVAAVLTGQREPRHWTGPDADRDWDVWDLKSLLQRMAAELGGGEVVPASSADEPWAALVGLIEPGEVLVAGAAEAETAGPLGGGGRVAAGVLDAPAWAARVWALELVIRAPTSAPPAARYRPIPEHPPVDRDLALVTADGVAAAAVEGVIREAAGALLEQVQVFDVYRGAGLPEGTRSIAWRLRFRGEERTLTDAEVDAAVQAVLSALEERLGVRRR